MRKLNWKRDISHMPRSEKLVEYATRFAVLMRDNVPGISLPHALDGPHGGWATAEIQLRIEEMEAEGVSDDDIQGACTAYECATGAKTGIVGTGPVVP